ncbi:MAG: M48 family metallopeptidase [Planctomycetota bacterium]|nr:M48 family metallopeptidase [Planctomycetota bacterium]
MPRLTRLLPLLVLAMSMGCQTNPSTGRSQFIIVSSEETTEMGIQAAPELLEEYGGEVASDELKAYMNRVGHVLLMQIESKYIDHPWEFFLLDSDVINAFALPGGKVFMSMGLLTKLQDESQVAGVVGHEIGHVTARHVDERLSSTMVAQFGLAVLGALTEGQIIESGAELLVGGSLLKFNRDQELEADKLGMKYMTRAYYDPYGMHGVMEVLRDATEGGGSPEFLSTHPHPESRLTQIDKFLAGKYAETQNNPAYGRFAQRFRRQAAVYFPTPDPQASLIPDPVSYCLLCRASTLDSRLESPQ